MIISPSISSSVDQIVPSTASFPLWLLSVSWWNLNKTSWSLQRRICCVFLRPAELCKWNNLGKSFFVNQCLDTCEIGGIAFEHIEEILRKNPVIFDPEERSLIFNLSSASLFWKSSRGIRKILYIENRIKIVEGQVIFYLCSCICSEIPTVSFKFNLLIF